MNQTIEAAKNGFIEKYINELISSYRNGQLDKKIFSMDMVYSKYLDEEQNELMIEKSKRLQKYMMEKLIIERNENMAQKLMKLIRHNPQNSTYFFAFGVGHFLGEKSIVEIVRNAGFEVTNINTNNYHHNVNTATQTSIAGLLFIKILNLFQTLIQIWAGISPL